MKRNIPVVVNNKMRDVYGATTFAGGNKKWSKSDKAVKVEINLKHHHAGPKQVASTIKHELLHVKNPKMTEKTVYKRSQKRHISDSEARRLIAKLRTKKLNYKAGTIKRKLKIKASDKVEPGSLIKKANEIRHMDPRKRTAFMGLV